VLSPASGTGDGGLAGPDAACWAAAVDVDDSGAGCLEISWRQALEADAA
jgi:hypothetical protein